MESTNSIEELIIRYMNEIQEDEPGVELGFMRVTKHKAHFFESP